MLCLAQVADVRGKPSSSVLAIDDLQGLWIAMQLTLTSCGEEIATLDAEPAWQLRDVLLALPQRFRKIGYRVRVLAGTEELGGQRTLSDIGARAGSVLTIVWSKLCLLLTASYGNVS